MEIKCELCGEMVVVGEDLVPGQHVRCPFCGGKFSYAERPTVESAEAESSSAEGLVIRCVCCEERIVVDSGVVIGQHVRCSCCGQKFTYGIENSFERLRQTGLTTDQFGVGVRCEDSLKKSNRSIRTRIEKRAESLAWQKMVVRRTIIFGVAIITLAISLFLYVNWSEEKDVENRKIADEQVRKESAVAEQNKRRDQLSQYIAAQTKDLKRKISDVIFEINGVSRRMRDRRDAGEDIGVLKKQKEELRKQQDSIQDVLNSFVLAGMRVDSMSTKETDLAHVELKHKKDGLDSFLKDRFPEKEEVVQKIEGCKIAPVAKPSQSNAVTVISDDVLIAAGINPEQFKKLDPEKRRYVEAEVRHDIEMRNRKQQMVVPDAVIDNGQKNDQPIPAAQDVKSMAERPKEEKPNLSEEPPKAAEYSKIEVQPQLRKCHKCFGKGTVTETVNEKCEDCEGRGYIMKEVIIKDTKFSTNGYWNYRDVGSRVTKSRQNCERCKHRGKITVKREKTCPACKGAGYFTKDGMPYRKPKGADATDAGELSQWLIPTAEKGGAIWHYLKFEPECSWFKPGYDHSKWFDGRSAFAGRDKNLAVGTEWNSQDIYLRKRFKFDGDASCIKVAKLRYTIDDNLLVWLNGEKIAELSGVDEDYREIDVTKELVRFLQKGDNVIAAWAHDCCGRRNVDIGLYISRQADKEP